MENFHPKSKEMCEMPSSNRIISWRRPLGDMRQSNRSLKRQISSKPVPRDGEVLSHSCSHYRTTLLEHPARMDTSVKTRSKRLKQLLGHSLEGAQQLQDHRIFKSKNRCQMNVRLTRIIAFVLFMTLGLPFQALGVKIVRMSVPRWVENGTVDSVILDCDYEYDSQKDELLVVKWFLDSDPEPIYQWITEYNTRHASARFSGHLNMNFMVTPSNQMTRYRALNIVRPTTDLSGKYSCHVVSLRSQDTAEEVMTVYAAPKRMDFNFTKSVVSGANLTCDAEGVFPLPHIAIYRHTVQDLEPQLVEDVRPHYDWNSLGGSVAFNAMMSHEIQDRVLPAVEPVTYECILSLPGTAYKIQKAIIYYPGSTALDSASSPRAPVLIIAFFLLAAI